MYLDDYQITFNRFSRAVTMRKNYIGGGAAAAAAAALDVCSISHYTYKATFFKVTRVLVAKVLPIFVFDTGGLYVRVYYVLYIAGVVFGNVEN